MSIECFPILKKCMKNRRKIFNGLKTNSNSDYKDFDGNNIAMKTSNVLTEFMLLLQKDFKNYVSRRF